MPSQGRMKRGAVGSQGKAAAAVAVIELAARQLVASADVFEMAKLPHRERVHLGSAEQRKALGQSLLKALADLKGAGS